MALLDDNFPSNEYLSTDPHMGSCGALDLVNVHTSDSALGIGIMGHTEFIEPVSNDHSNDNTSSSDESIDHENYRGVYLEDGS